jgi:alcohol dehydrogenase class IV
LKIRGFKIPALIVTGSGSASQTGEECKKLNLKKALIVTDKIMVKTGTVDGITKSLADNNIEYAIFDQVSAEPTMEFVNDGYEAFKECSCDFLLAVGGGSPIDTAKAIAVLTANPAPIEQYKGLGNIPAKGVHLVVVPTTAGTGSEATQFTIITNTQNNVKMLIGSPHLMPDIAIVDPLLTLSMPRSLTAATGIDALTHAIEAYVSLKAQPMTDVYGLSAIRLIAGNLRQAWANPNNVEAREKTMLGSLLAGIAFSNASVALVHGMSRPIGAYFHVPHGASNAALLGVVTAFSLIGNPARYAEIAEAMGEDIRGLTDLEGAKLAKLAVDKLLADVEIPSLKELGVSKDKLYEFAPTMAKDAIDSGSPGNNPRIATEKEIVELYKLAYGD